MDETQEAGLHFIMISPSWVSRLAVWLGISTTLILSFCIYQLYFHPLAKYPGPLLAKFTMLRAGYHGWKGDIQLDIWHCHEKYGPIIRYGPNFVIFNTATGFKDIYGTGRNLWKDRKFASLSPQTANILTTYDKKDHARRRRLIGGSLTDSKIKAFEPTLRSHILTFCKQIYPAQTYGDLTNGWSPAMSMSDWCAYMIIDMITDFLFGINFHLLENSDARPLVHHIEDLSIRNGVLLAVPELTIGRLDKRLFKKSVKATKSYWTWVQSTLRQRERSNQNDSDVYGFLAGAKDPQGEASFSPREIASELGLLAIAGFDTTRTAMTAALFYISRNSHVYDRLAAEIRTEFQSVDEIQLGPRLHSCTYLRACIDESMRMSPPIGSSPLRQPGPGGAVIDGEFIPEGYSVGTGIYSIHHNAEYFPNPHQFTPERWLENTGPADEVTKSAFNPFSIGSRSCVGRSLAYAELQLTIAILLWKYDLRTAPGPCGNIGAGVERKGEAKVGRANPEEFQLLDRIISVSEGPFLQFRPRERVEQ